MKYIITESRLNQLLTDVIEDRYAGIEFKTGFFNSFIGYLPHQNVSYDEWSVVYENEDVADSDRMVLWVYNDDYQYFLSMTPLSEREVNKAIKDWFYKKTRLKVDLVYVQ
jgi:hypothetical protein